MYSRFSAAKSRGRASRSGRSRSICQVTCSLVILAPRRRALARFNPCSSRGRHARVISRQPRNSPHFLRPAGYSITVSTIGDPCREHTLRILSVSFFFFFLLFFSFFFFSRSRALLSANANYHISLARRFILHCTGRDGRFGVEIERP